MIWRSKAKQEPEPEPLPFAFTESKDYYGGTHKAFRCPKCLRSIEWSSSTYDNKNDVLRLACPDCGYRFTMLPADTKEAQ